MWRWPSLSAAERSEGCACAAMLGGIGQLNGILNEILMSVQSTVFKERGPLIFFVRVVENIGSPCWYDPLSVLDVYLNRFHQFQPTPT